MLTDDEIGNIKEGINSIVFCLELMCEMTTFYVDNMKIISSILNSNFENEIKQFSSKKHEAIILKEKYKQISINTEISNQLKTFFAK